MLCRWVRTVLVESEQLERDLLVDLALGESLEHLELATAERARIDPGACAPVVGYGQGRT